MDTMKHDSMMKRLILSLSALLVCAGLWAASGLKPVSLQCNRTDNPTGVEKPSLGWKLAAAGKDAASAVQTAYEIQIASGSAKKIAKADVWRSGKVMSDRQFGISPGGAGFAPATTYWWRVRVWDAAGKASAWSEPACFQTALSDAAWTAEWITYDTEKAQRLPLLRKEIQVGKGVVRATAFVCGLGASDLFINGEYADPTRVLDPAQTNYEQYALYSAIDVTDRLVPGKANCLGVMLYDGWFNQNSVFADFSYGKPMLRLQLLVEYANGKSETFITDESWQWKEGPVVKSNIYSGEVYDARLEVPGWAEVGAPSEGWQSCRKATQGVPPSLRAQLHPAIRLQETLDAVRFWKTEAGSWVYDFGTNNTAEVRFRVSLPEGTRLTVRTGEEIHGEGQGVDFRSTGIVVVPVQTDEYICAGKGLEEWNPRGTYHGFRYAELSCPESVTPSKDWLQAVLVHTDLREKASFSCAEPQLNKLHEMALRTVQGNIVGVPMDCPTREKCGWLGDSHAYIKMAMVGYDMDNFLYKYMDDICSGAARFEPNTLHHKYKNQYFYFTDKASGIPYMIAPGKRLCGVASPDWGTAIVQLPWHMYLYDGDVDALVKYYASMAQWTDYLTDTSVGHIVYTGLGDWCPMGSGAPSVELTSTAFHYYDLCIMEQVAGILDKKEDQARFAAERKAVKEAFFHKFYNPVLHSFGSQTGDAMAMDLGLCPEGEEKEVASAAAMLVDHSRRFFNCGIFGLCRIGSALSRNGQAPLAYKTFTKKGNNSFAYMWEKYDATTLWESLPVNDGNYSASVSHCHPMQAGFDIYFYEDLAGIRPVAEAPGYKRVLFDTCAWDIDLASTDATIDTPYGPVRSAWNKENGNMEWEVSLPVGTTGVIAVPEGVKKPAALEDGSFQEVCRADGKVYYALPAGVHTFVYTL